MAPGDPDADMSLPLPTPSLPCPPPSEQKKTSGKNLPIFIPLHLSSFTSSSLFIFYTKKTVKFLYSLHFFFNLQTLSISYILRKKMVKIKKVWRLKKKWNEYRRPFWFSTKFEKITHTAYNKKKTSIVPSKKILQKTKHYIHTYTPRAGYITQIAPMNRVTHCCNNLHSLTTQQDKEKITKEI